MVVIKPWETPGKLKDLEGEGRPGGGGWFVFVNLKMIIWIVHMTYGDWTYGTF